MFSVFLFSWLPKDRDLKDNGSSAAVLYLISFWMSLQSWAQRWPIPWQACRNNGISKFIMMGQWDWNDGNRVWICSDFAKEDSSMLLRWRRPQALRWRRPGLWGLKLWRIVFFISSLTQNNQSKSYTFK